MSDFENVRDFSACNSMKEIQETPVGGDGEWLSPARPCQAEMPHKGHSIPWQPLPLPNSFLSLPAEFITTTDTQESAVDTTKAKRVRGERLGDVATALQNVPKGLSPPRGFISLYFTQIQPPGWVSPLS